MKIAVFTDIHGNLPALEEIIKDIKKENFDKVICLGDVIGIGPKPKECLDLIMNNNIDMVLGNHELYYLNGVKIRNETDKEKKKHYDWVKSQLSIKHQEYLKNLNYQISLNNTLFEHFLLRTPNYKYPFYKTTIINNRNFSNIINLTKEKYIFVGHDHFPFEKEKSGKHIICLGSSGCTHDDNTFYTVVEIDKEVKWYRKMVKYSHKKLDSILEEIDYPVKKYYEENFFKNF